MYDREFELLLERAEKVTQRLKSYLFIEKVPLSLEYAKTGPATTYADGVACKYHVCQVGDCWGKPWDNAFFHIQAQIPGGWSLENLALRLNFSGEAILFDTDGVPAYGLTNSSYFNGTFTKEFYHLSASACARGKIDLYCECAANEICGLDMDYDPALDTLHPYGKFTPVIRVAELGIFDFDVWHLALALEVLASYARTLGAGDHRSSLVCRTLADVCDRWHDDPRRALELRKFIDEFLANHPGGAFAVTAHAVGHAHLDVAWQWPLAETIRKVGRTFSCQLKMLADFPDYVFGESQPQLYEFCRTSYPELFHLVRRAVADGRWELQGGMWVEPDCIIPDAESLIRQLLYGKNFYRDQFGIEVTNVWLPDAFGYTAALPQIIRKSGCKFFLTNKLCVNQFNKFPRNAFVWRGIDGSTVFAYCPPEENYNSELLPAQMIPAADRMAENDRMTDYLTLFGIGDGGGGPKEEYIARGTKLKDFDGTPRVKFGKAADFFTLLEQRYGRNLPEYEGELYVELHRGTLTSQARLKRANRKLEQQMNALEIIASGLPLSEFPSAILEKAWKILLLNQFHDILPGSSIGTVCAEASESYRQAQTLCQDCTADVGRRLFTPQADSLVLVNTLDVAFDHPVELPSGWLGVEKYPSQVCRNTAFVAVKIPPLCSLELRQAATEMAEQAVADLRPVLENDLVRYVFLPDGRLGEAWDKKAQRSILSAPGNQLNLFNDHPNFWEAWDIDRFYRQEKIDGSIFCTRLEATGRGPVFDELSIEWQIGEHSTLRQVVRLGKGSPRLDFICEANWHEIRKLLRVEFPVALTMPEAASDIAGGFIKRSTHCNTSWEFARFEAAAHRYFDLSEAAYGVALLNDCKYGYAVRKDALDLALLRAPKSPDWDADQGTHHFTYALLPHQQTLAASNVMAESAMLNRLPLCFDGFAGKFALPCRLTLTDGVGIAAIKKAENESAWIVRLIERRGAVSRAELTLFGSFQITETNLIEWTSIHQYPFSDRIALTLTPFEIKTLKLTPANDRPRVEKYH